MEALYHMWDFIWSPFGLWFPACIVAGVGVLIGDTINIRQAKREFLFERMTED